MVRKGWIRLFYFEKQPHALRVEPPFGADYIKNLLTMVNVATSCLLCKNMIYYNKILHYGAQLWEDIQLILQLLIMVIRNASKESISTHI